MKNDPFWLDDYKVLYEEKRYLEFVPTKEMTKQEKLNAIVRLGLYVLALVIIIDSKNTSIMSLVVAVIISTIFLNQTDLIDFSSSEKYNESQDDKQENKTKEDKKKAIIPPEKKDKQDTRDIKKDKKKEKTRKKREKENALFMSTCKGDVCIKPSDDNPFMNPLLSDLDEFPNRPPACDNDEDDIKDEMKKKFYDNLYMDIESTFDKQNSYRQFHTVPSTTYPNDQTGFAKWCYESPATCKTNQESCLRFEDLRFKRM
jgi:hypothetical protein